MENAVSELKPEHQGWLDQIRAMEKEIRQMTQRNGEIVAAAADSEARKRVDHFENQFTIQLRRLDQMKHNIKVYGGDLDAGKKELEDYIHYYGSLKDEFNSFASGFN
jgi:hypothetical protein